MKTLILIDAHNVIYKHKEWARLAKLDIDKARLAIAEYVISLARKFPSNKYIIIFDGGSDIIIPRIANIEIIFSGLRIADDIIKEKIKENSELSRIELISSDVDLYKFARERSRDISSSEKFVAGVANSKNSLSPKSEKPSGSGRKSKSDFLDAFSSPLDDNDWLKF